MPEPGRAHPIERTGRGATWVLVQFALMAGYVLLPAAPFAAAPGSVGRAVAGALGLAGLIVMGLGMRTLGHNLTPMPRPRAGGALVQSGVYRVVRHPIYAGLILIAVSWAVWRMSATHLVGCLILFFFFDAKARLEERWLSRRHPEYAAYARKVKKLVPFVY